MRKNKPIKKNLPNYQEVKHSEYGCDNCLWNGVECVFGKKFMPIWVDDKYPSCTEYFYYN